MIYTVKDACTPTTDALDIHVGDSIAVINESSLNLEEGRDFMRKSYLTKGMLQLVQEAMKRLSGGKGSRPVFKLKQAMGGGKTHLLKTIAYLARYPELREEFFPLQTGGFGDKTAKIAFFNGRNQPEDFFWGQIASQLGKPAFFPAGIAAPGMDGWQKLFDAAPGPTLILLDELPTYLGYYRTVVAGAGTVADSVSRGFETLITAVLSRPDVCLVVSDLEATHASGTQMIDQAFVNAKNELGRCEFVITPIDLSGDETYSILKKRLFATLPSKEKIEYLADEFSKRYADAQQAKVIGSKRTPEQFAKEIAETYPFHPQMKHIFTLFKENKDFQQTRGLIELTSRLLKSVWERPSNDVLLIGPQHFGMHIDEVRTKVVQISRLEEAVSQDIFSESGGAKAQIIDAHSGNTAATEVANLLLISSMSTVMNPVRGLTKSEALECLVTPNSDLSFYGLAMDALHKDCWYLHKTPEDRLYFDKLENLGKMIAGLAESAPETSVRALQSHRLAEMFAPKRKAVYGKVLALPTLDEIAEEVQKGRVLVVIPPDSKLPPEDLVKVFETLERKNNLIVLSGERAFEMDRFYNAAKLVFATMQAERTQKVLKGSPQWEEFEGLQQRYEMSFLSSIKNIFDQVLFPHFDSGTKQPILRKRQLLQVKDTHDGEAQIEATLAAEPFKFFRSIDAPEAFNAVRSRVEKLFAGDNAPWADIKSKVQSDCSMYFLPPGELDKLKTRVVSEGKWEDLDGGWVTKSPKPKEASVQVTVQSEMDESGDTVLHVSPVNIKPEAAAIHWSESPDVSEQSPKLTSEKLATKSAKVYFLCRDVTGKSTSAKPVVWTNALKIRHELVTLSPTQRTIKISVLPQATSIRYTLDGSEPRNGASYTGDISVGSEVATLLVFAEFNGLGAKDKFIVPGVSGAGNAAQIAQPPVNQPVIFPKSKGRPITERSLVFAALNKARERGILFSDVVLTLSQSNQSSASMSVQGGSIQADEILSHLELFGKNFDPTAPVTLMFKKAKFPTGQDLMDFAKELEMNYGQDWEAVQ